MKDDEPSGGFTRALRGELERTIAASARTAGNANRAGITQPRWRAPLVTAITGLCVAGVAIAVILGAPARPHTAVAPTDGHHTNGPVLLQAPAKTPGTGQFASAAGQGTLRIRIDGCVTINDQVLIAPNGSKFIDSDKGVDLVGIGRFNIGDYVPAIGGYSPTYSQATLPTAYKRCGPGVYMEVWASN